MEYIYARVSTDSQDTKNQLHALKERYPTAEIIQETISGYKDKPELTALLARLSTGDTLVVSALDRLGRHARKALMLIEELSARGVKVISLREGIDTNSSSGKFIATCMFGLAEMERNMISERTKQALARKKAEGVVLGRPKENHTERIKALQEYRRQGLTIMEIHKATGVSTGRICQLLKQA